MKTFVFRDYSAEEIVNENVAAINKLLNQPDDKSYNSFGAYKNEDDGTWVLAFYKEGGVEWLTMPFSGRFLKCKEIHLTFEIEEDFKSGEFKARHCDIEPFKEYQI